MLRLGILSIFLLSLLAANMYVVKADSSSSNNVIYVNEIAGKTIRLKSVLSLMAETSSSSSNPLGITTTRRSGRREEEPSTTSSSSGGGRHRQQKIFWSVKRLYAVPSWTNNQSGAAAANVVSIRTLNELSQVENMISLDAEVEHKLQAKYSTTNESSSEEEEIDASNYDLTIFNLNYADSGVYKCNLWNQRTIYYKLIVSSKINNFNQ